MKLLKLAVVPALLITGADLKADPFPHRRPGLWEITRSGSDARLPPTAFKLCIDAATESALIDAGGEATKAACSKNDVQVKGSRVTADLVCKFGERQQTIHSVTIFTGDTAFHTDSTVHSEPAPAGKADRTSMQDGKWAGPCGADMKPGDIVTSTGIKMNVAPSKTP